MLQSNLERIQRVEAWEFCNKWLKPDEGEEGTKLYKGRCDRLIQKVLGRNSLEGIRRWGKRYESMPEEYKKMLGYADSLLSAIDRHPGLLDILKSRDRDR